MNSSSNKSFISFFIIFLILAILTGLGASPQGRAAVRKVLDGFLATGRQWQERAVSSHYAARPR